MKTFVQRMVPAALAAMSAVSAHALSFTTFVDGSDLNSVLSNQATIGFAYAGDKFVGSVYYGVNNNQLYSTDLLGKNLAKFGSPIPGYSGEVYVSSSLGIGGFGARDVYAGSEANNTIYRIAHDGSSQGLFVTGLDSGVRSIAFDPYGLYGNNMLVATQYGSVYQVNSSGVATLLANVGEDTEGIGFAPQSFGGYAKGTLFVASEGSGSLRAIAPNGGVNTVLSGLYGAEMISFVPTNLGASGNPVEGFYAAAYPYNIQHAPAADFVPYIGHAIVTGESGHQVWDVSYDNLGGTFSVQHLGYFPAQPEDGIFVTADVIKPPVPEPSSVALVLAGAGVLVLKRKRRAD